MSGIYIPNMEMPNNCYECPFAAASYYKVHEYNRRLEWGGILTRKTLTTTKRNMACPLVPVPPHGRLIDADALCEGRVSNDNVVICAKAAPTIIPAEEGE